MKLAIVGGRKFNDYSMLYTWAYLLTYQAVMASDEIVIVSGGAKGADTLGAKFADEHDYPKEVFLPDWDMFGKFAGFVRNQQIVDACDTVLAFWDGQSKGTRDTINKAKIAKKPTFIVYY